ncbi:recombinase family protein [Aeromonas media]|uniref:recombinase family protein n=1 Tax=Aeromonas media TaxID=651 RepID=UPI003D22EDEA
MPKAYLYLRFSTKKQEHGDSYRRQHDDALKWCESHNAELNTQTFEDLGISAFKEGGKRPALADLIEAIKLGKIPAGSFVLVEDDDRLSRRGWKSTMDLIHQLVNLGIKLVMLKSGKIYDQQSIGDLASNVILMFNADRAHKESLRKSELVRAAKKNIRDQDILTGRIPFWLSYQGDTVILNEHVSSVKHIIELRQKGHSFQYIARELNQQSIPSPNETGWGAASVRVCITNSLLYGAKTYFETQSDGSLKKSKTTPNIVPAVCDYNAWIEIQPTREPKGKKSITSMFGGLVKCGVCGGGTIRRTMKTKGHPYFYHTCINYREGKGQTQKERKDGTIKKVKECSQKEAMPKLDDILSKILDHLTYEIKANSTAAIEADISIHQQMLDELNQAAKMLTGNPSALAMLFVNLSETQTKLDELKAERDSNQIVNADFKRVMDLETVEERNLYLRRLIEKITIRFVKGDIRQWNVSIHKTNKHTQNFEIYFEKRGWRYINADIEKFKNELLALTAGTEYDEFDDVELVPETCNTSHHAS